MLGWITKTQARKMGYTNIIRLNGIIPGYGKDLDSGCPELIMCHPVLDWIEFNITSPFYAFICEVSGNEPHWAIQVREEL